MIKNKRIPALLLAAAMLFAFALTVAAADTLKLTIVCEDGGKALAGVGFDIYKVADIDRDGNFILTDELSGKGVDPGSYDDIPKTLAATLEGIVLRDGIKPAASIPTDENGKAYFTTTDSGLYLVRADKLNDNGTIYDFTPFMVILDSTYVETSDVTVNAKYEVTPPFIIPPMTSVKVIKLWDDGDDRESRPESIKVDLLKNGEAYDTAYLTPENGWKYTWDKLEGLYSWTVAEEIPDGYTMTLEKDGMTFVITNTKTPPPPDTETTETTAPDTEPETTEPNDTTSPSETTGPSETETTGPSETTEPSETTGPSETTSPDTEPDTISTDTEPVETTTSEPTLPQTGQLWWPVPVLVVIGLTLIIVGLVRSRSTENGEEKR